MDDKVLFEVKLGEIVDSRTEEGREKSKEVLRHFKMYVNAIPEDKNFFAVIVVNMGDKNEMETLSNLSPLKTSLCILQISEHLDIIAKDTLKKWQEFRDGLKS